MVKVSPLSAKEIAEAVGGTIVLDRADSTCEVTELGEPSEVGAQGLAFVIAEAFIKEVAQTRAGVIVVQSALAEKVKAALPESVHVLITAPDAYLGLAQLSKIIAETDPNYDWAPALPGLGKAEIDPTAKIDPTAVVGAGARIGARTVLLPRVVVGPGATVGTDCVLFPGAVLYPRTVLGNRVRLHANVVLGSDGFGYARGPKGSVKIWHLGRVVVEDDVEIGAGTTIDRGTMRDSVIERGAKIDNLCQIGHNALIRSHAILCGQVGLAGNVTVGRGAILAGQAGVADKVDIGDGAIVGPSSGISRDVKAGDVFMGVLPAKPRREWWKIMAVVDKLPEIYSRLKALEKRQS